MFCSDTNEAIPFVDLASDKLENETLNAIFLTCNCVDICEHIMKKFGVLAICPENIKNFLPLCEDNSQVVDENSEGNWSVLFANVDKNWSNSIVIVDNYLLRPNYLESNVFPIIDYFIHDSVDAPIKLEVTFFSSFKGANLNWKTFIYDRISTRYGDKIVLSLFSISDTEFHDRVIVTNNLWIECGAGFDLYKMENGILKAQKFTTLHVVSPFFNDSYYSWSHKAYRVLINHISRILASNEMREYDVNVPVQYTYPNIYIGEKRNSILSYF